MRSDVKQVLNILWENFGDQGLAWVEAKLTEEPGQAGGGQAADKEPSEERAGEHALASGESLLEDVVPDRSATNEDEERPPSFVQENMAIVAGGAIISPVQAIAVVTGMVELAAEVRKFEEAEVTKRVGIAAERDVAIADIKAKQELIRDYLERSFDERAENFSKLFEVVDAALESGDANALAMGLESVVKLATSSPFKDLRTVEETAAALSDPTHEWDF